MSKYSKTIDEAFLECYCLLYENAEPKADFKVLMDNAKINERGEKEIQMDDHEINSEVMDRIIQDTIKKFKIRKYDRRGFSAAIYLGCSPKAKY